MPSYRTPIVVDGKTIGFACHRGPLPSCKCGRRGTKQCDFPLTGRKAGKTCDVHLCDRCATNVAPDRDYCPAHVRVSVEQKQGEQP